ncbi:hypothetical protein TNCV_1544521 [Trichonephila clavipes]|nr:hypothetical protein TNCV_1544521 [Trichonephila clavipes]
MMRAFSMQKLKRGHLTRYDMFSVKLIEIHRQLVEVYGENVMSGGMVRKGIRQFNDGHTNAPDETQSGRPFVANVNFV